MTRRDAVGGTIVQYDCEVSRCAGPILDNDIVISACQGPDEVAAIERPGRVPGVNPRLETQGVYAAVVGNDRVGSGAKEVDITSDAAIERVLSAAAIQRVIADIATRPIKRLPERLTRDCWRTCFKNLGGAKTSGPGS